MSDPKAIVNKLQDTFAKFQAENDAALKGKANSDTVDNINKEITDLKAALDTATKQAARSMVGGLGGDNAAVVAGHAASFMTRARGKKAKVGDPADIEAYQNYVSAFGDLVRGGLNADMLGPDIRAALSVGSDRDGGYMVPTEMSSEMERRLFETSPIRQIARVIRIGTSAWEAPYKSSKGTSGGWVGERTQRNNTDTGKVGIQRIETHEQYAYPEVTQSMLDDASMDVESFVIEDTEDEMIRVENAGCVTGDGVMKPKGYMSYKDTAVTTSDKNDRPWGKLQYIPIGDAGAFPSLSSGADKADCFIDTIYALNQAYRAGSVWTMNSTVEAAVRKLKDAEGRYLIGMSQIEGSLEFDIHGYPIVNMEDMPDLGADSFPIAYGNFRRGYFLIDRMGFRLLRDPYTNKPYVGYYITKGVGGDVRNFDAIKLMKAAAS
ncbi:MAG: phage major capsid protein [Thalassospira sp.]|uniref:phage major capsid protein n=1 Tax=unclassified Thalassospira TaxID=2648997 RepID=UPI0013149B37|nr:MULTISPECIES: phage major capsid protein [unclassified Thalassospira]MBL4839386.1 phage major capsid protein [Thalassospira sp.]QPL37476.1 phage major capsid protein [Thalassospira sp. B30-1]